MSTRSTSRSDEMVYQEAVPAKDIAPSPVEQGEGAIPRSDLWRVRCREGSAMWPPGNLHYRIMLIGGGSGISISTSVCGMC
jgi:hypothetical protein